LTAFDFAGHFVENLPPPAAKWGGFAKHNFIGGHNAPETIVASQLADCITRVLTREAQSLAFYNAGHGPQGYLPLRQWLSAKLERQAAIKCSTDEILITSGSSPAIDLVNKTLVAPGDTVIVEQSNYGGVLSRFKRLKCNMIAIDLDDDGMRMDHLDRALSDLKAKGKRASYIYTIPTVQNPTATIMPLERRQEMLRLAAAHETPIFEDECYSDLIWTGERPPAIYALDDNGQTIFTSTFSKSIAPAIRVGYLVAKWPFLSQAVACKSDAGSGMIEQMMLAEFCPAHFDDHLAKLIARLKEKRDVLIDALNENFGTTVEFTPPPGGIFLWVKFPETVDTTRLTEVAGKAGIAINPGVDWSEAHPAGNRLIRLCYASASPEELRAGVAALADVCHDTFGVPEHSANRARES
jgi:2-aminoadipate transaminase